MNCKYTIALLVIMSEILGCLNAMQQRMVSTQTQWSNPVKPPLPWPQLKGILPDGSEQEDNAKRAIIAYQTLIVDGYMTAYERELGDIVMKSLPDFIMSRDCNKRQAVIVAIDETVLSNLPLFISSNFVEAKGASSNDEFHRSKSCLGIKSMIPFCQALQACGYTLIYVSSRQEVLAQATRENLQEQGFPVNEVDGIFLKEQEFFDGQKKISNCTWKQLVRTKLSGASISAELIVQLRRDIAEKKDLSNEERAEMVSYFITLPVCKKVQDAYEIVGCVGDQFHDVNGDYTGMIKVLLPNYLYRECEE